MPERLERTGTDGSPHETGAVTADLVETPEGRTVRAYFFPGLTERRALVVAGIHGSELSSIEVAEQLIVDLKQAATPPFFGVIVIPTLFPDGRARAEARPSEIGSEDEIGRCLPSGLDPNRNFPATGTDYDPSNARDSCGRPIANENAALLALVERFQPTRIGSLHATRALDDAGIYADPRSEAPSDPGRSPEGRALGFAPDAHLALRMAEAARSGGAAVPGNRLGHPAPNAVYPLDPAPAPAGKLQRRASSDAADGFRQAGVSFGEYAATATPKRAAITVITVEVQTSKRALDMPTEEARNRRRREVRAHCTALRDVLLGAPERPEKLLP